MRYVALIISAIGLVLLLGIPGTGSEDGREGNRLYAEEAYAEAAEAYLRGLERFGEPTADALFWGLQNNLGAALYQAGSHEDAAQAFNAAMLGATDDDAFARSAYNAGNNAYRQGDPEAALDLYREALRANPSFEQARYNYEFIKRQMGEEGADQPDEGDQDDDGEPAEDQPEPAPPDEGEDGETEDEGLGQADDEGDGDPSEADGGAMEDGGGDADHQAAIQELLGEHREMSTDEALRILQALQLDEINVLRDALRADIDEDREVEKDW